MLTVTNPACTRLSEILDDYPDHVSARIILTDGGMKVRRSIHRPGDEVFEHKGRAVLLLDKQVSARLESKTLDIRHTEAGPRLGFRRVAR